jgi:leucyl-tRNA synthetase
MNEPNKDGTDIMMALLMGLSGPRASKAWNESQQIKAESFLTMAEHWINQTAEENARLKAECQARQAENSVLAVECDSLKSEVERLTKESDILQKCCEHQKNRIERLKQNEQLIDAGNALHDAAKIAVKWGVTATQMGMPRALYDALRNWNAAKEGKQSK